MKWNKAPAVSVLTALFVAAGARPANANATPKCTPVAVAADANVRRRWPDLPQWIQQAFERRDDIDACARIDVTITDTAVVVRVTLPDGRTAARSVLRREDVLPALEALLLLPETNATTAETPAKPARVEPGAKTQAVVTAPAREAARPSTDHDTRLRIEIGIGPEARAGDGQMGAGLGVSSFLELAHWLLGFQARLDGYRVVASGTHSMAMELDALFGRRFELGTSTLDLFAGPALAMRGSASVKVTAPAGSAATPPQPRDEQGLPRLLVSSRLTFRAQATLRTFVQLDGEIGRRSTSSDPLPDQADLPAWTVGLAIGATVGTR